MTLHKQFTYLALSAAICFSLVAAPSFADDHKKGDKAVKADIVDTAVAAGSFTTLAAALDAAGLVETLKGEGPFTVFAPTDDAFAALPEGTVENLLKPENKDKLTAVLTYHVVAGKLKAGDVTNMRKVKTVQGAKAAIDLKDGGAFISNAKIVKTDIKASNGIIHVIDAVILPPEGKEKKEYKKAKAPAPTKDIVGTAVGAGSFNTLAAALEAAGLVETLQGEGPFTVFAPTDEAFAALPEGTVETLLKPENKAKLTAILTYHVVPGKLDAGKVTNLRKLETVQGDKVKVSLKDEGAFINDSKIVSTDVFATNGVIHVIDSVLIPGDKKEEKKMGSADTGKVKLIEYAIRRGAPLYNHGNPAACAAVYEVAAMSLLQYADLNKKDSRALKMALDRGHHSASDRAWALRRAFDGIVEREMSTKMSVGLSYTPM